MTDKEKVEETPSRGNEWEVVSLTASAYAAAPGPKGLEVNDENADKDNVVEEDKPETSHAMFMSSHFVFPPSQHENLPLESQPDVSNIHKEHGEKHVAPALFMEEKGKFDKAEEDWDIEELTGSHEFPGLQFFDQKGNRLAIHGTEFNEGTDLQGLNMAGTEEKVYGATTFSSFHSETSFGGSTASDENGLDLVDIPQSPKPRKDDDYDESHLPCGAWWKRQAACLYAHVKEVNSFWSICISAAVMGLVILGHRWQQETWRSLHLKWQFSVSDEKTGRMLGPLSRFKDVVVGGQRRGSSLGGSGAAD